MSSPHMPPSPPELIARFGMILERFPDLEQRKMFGYPAAFVAAGHMVTGLHGNEWVVRLGEKIGPICVTQAAPTSNPCPADG